MRAVMRTLRATYSTERRPWNRGEWLLFAVLGAAALVISGAFLAAVAWLAGDSFHPGMYAAWWLAAFALASAPAAYVQWRRTVRARKARQDR
jgi:membrane protein implicated in regulation of membrane protease activity